MVRRNILIRSKSKPCNLKNRIGELFSFPVSMRNERSNFLRLFGKSKEFLLLMFFLTQTTSSWSMDAEEKDGSAGASRNHSQVVLEKLEQKGAVLARDGATIAPQFASDETRGESTRTAISIP